MKDSASPRIVAVEEHFNPPDYFDNLNKLPHFADETAEYKFWSAFENTEKMVRQLTDDEARIQAMDEAGIDMFVWSLNPPGVQMFSDKETATSLARDANDQLAEMIKRRPDRYYGVGALAPQDPEQAAREVKRSISTLGLGGIMVSSHTNGVYLDDPQSEPILAALEEEDATLYIHPRCPSPQMIGPYEQYGMRGALWGFQGETNTHAIRLIMSGVFDRHPKLRVVLGHLGEALPYWMWRLDNIYKHTFGWMGERLEMVKLDRKPSEYFRDNFYITTSGMSDPDILNFCVDKVGADKILFATDFPYEVPKQAVDGLHQARLDEKQLEQICHENAEKLFRAPTKR